MCVDSVCTQPAYDKNPPHSLLLPLNTQIKYKHVIVFDSCLPSQPTVFLLLVCVFNINLCVFDSLKQ